MKTERSGYVSGFLGMLGFSLTLPATRIAVSELDPVFVGLGRAVVAAGLSIIVLLITRQSFPSKRFLPQYGIVAAGVIVGFPLLTAWAMQDVPANHGAVVIGLLPLATALAAVWRGGERPSPQFWLFSILGSALVVAFALSSDSGSLHLADLALLGAVNSCGSRLRGRCCISSYFWRMASYMLGIGFLSAISAANNFVVGLTKVFCDWLRRMVGFCLCERN